MLQLLAAKTELFARSAADRALLADVAQEAGMLALEYFGTTLKQWTKQGNSPVSEADIAVNQLIYERLTAARSDYGWLSEETEDSTSRLSVKTIFIIDPIDGTRGFLAGKDEWCISLAVVEDGRPIAAALFNPLRKELYSTALHQGAYLGDMPLRISDHSTLSGARIAGPPTLIHSIEEIGITRIKPVASLAYRIALVAAGHLDGTAIRAKSYDWDLAAADLLIHEAGGWLTNLSGQQPQYNQINTTHDVLIASGKSLHVELIDHVRYANKQRK